VCLLHGDWCKRHIRMRNKKTDNAYGFIELGPKKGGNCVQCDLNHELLAFSS